MNPEMQKRLFKLTPKKIVAISLVTFILLAVATAGQLSYMALKYNKIYNGVYINDLPIGGLLSGDLTSLLNKDYQDKAKNLELELKSKGKSVKLEYSDLNITYDIPTAVDKAYSVGRTGNVFQRLFEIANSSSPNKKLSIPFSYDKQKVESAVNSLYTQTLVPVKEADLLIQDDKVILRSGRHGENIDENAVLAAVDDSIKACKGGAVDIPTTVTAPSSMDIDDYYKRINQDKVDATIKVENNKVTIVPHKIGRNIDKPTLVSIASELEKTEDTEKVLPVTFSMPALKTEDINAKLFKDTLATASTQFYTGTPNDKNRGENIRIAVPKVDGKILAPGQVFSFNEAVGPREESNGYKVAHTYVGGNIVDGIGGGICQVSTTLYNAVLFTDLDVLERTNHMFTVAYVPLGRDASVSYDAVDFKFKNTSNWPVKIEANVTDDDKIVFALIGTNESPGETIEINPRLVKTVDFDPNIKYVDDPTMEEGKTKVDHEGMKGYVVDTYKVVKKDGKVISETKISTSVYQTLQKQVRRGTKKPQTQPVKAQQSPAPQTVGVDEADNPPAKQSE